MSLSSVRTSTAPIRAWRFSPLLFGFGGVGAVALGLFAPWTIVIVGAAIVFTLSFVESEPFFLLVIFLLPVNVILAGDSVVHDMGVALRMLVVVGFFLGKLIRQELDVRALWRPAITRSSLLFLGALILSAILCTSGEVRAAIRGVYFISFYILFYLMAFVWMNSRERLEKLLLTLMASTLAVCAFAFYQFAVGSLTPLWSAMYAGADPSGYLQRPPSVLDHPGHLAGYLITMLAFSLACFLLTDVRLWKLMSGCVLLAGTVALALTQTRGGMSAFGVVLLAAIWCFAKGWRNRILLTIGLLVVAITSAYLAANFGPERLKTEGDQSSMERIILWGVAWQLFQSSPLHGVGFGSFELISGRYLQDIPGMEQNLGAHNLYFELLAETGIIGLGAFFVFIFTAIRQGLRQLGAKDWLHRSVAFAAFAGGLGLMIAGLTDHTLFWSVQIGSLFWLFLGLLLASERYIQALHSLTGT